MNQQDVLGAIPLWLQRMELDRRSPNTIKTYKSVVYRWAQQADAGDMSPAHVSEWLAEAQRSGLNWSTIRGRANALVGFAKYLADPDVGLLPANPLAGWRKPQPGKRTVVPGIAEDEHAAILATCKGATFQAKRDRAILHLLTSGLRASELLSIELAGVDMKNRAVAVMGKGAKPRKVPFTTAAAQALALYLHARQAHRLAGQSPMLWLGESGTAGTFGYNGLRKMLGKRARLAGLDPAEINAHRWRHAFARNWLRAGGSQTGLMACAGWSSPAMVSHYTEDVRQELAIEEAHRLMG